MFCPRCKAEYRSGAQTCALCFIALVEALDPEWLRAQVRRAGGMTGVVRALVAGIALLPGAGLMAVAIIADPAPGTHPNRLPPFLVGLGMAAAGILLIVPPVTGAYGAGRSGCSFVLTLLRTRLHPPRKPPHRGE